MPSPRTRGRTRKAQTNPFGSTLEGRVYQALIILGYKTDQIEIQTPVLGGRSRLGGQIVDFIVYTPRPVPIRVNGNWWHKNSEEELNMEASLKQVFGNQPVITIWGDEANTMDETVATLRRKIGHL